MDNELLAEFMDGMRTMILCKCENETRALPTQLNWSKCK